mgnify:CR=1 FL=1
MKGVKVNYTDVRISAMEDFVGRGDRRLAPVVRRAWELGAGMDSWWESLEKAFNAWETAIADAGLDWKYRKMDNGEWDWETMESGSQNDRLDAPLPWDHIDTGIDKNWLQEDLKRALEAKIPKKQKTILIWLQIYQQAYKQNDTVTLKRAENKLKELGYTFNKGS